MTDKQAIDVVDKMIAKYEGKDFTPELCAEMQLEANKLLPDWIVLCIYGFDGKRQIRTFDVQMRRVSELPCH